MPVDQDSYVVQPNAISRAVYIMPTMVRRLIFVAILNVQVSKPSNMKFSMDLHDLAIQFGFRKTKRYPQLKTAINIASKQVIRFEKEGGAVTEWIPWLTYCNLDLNTRTLTIQINEYLHDYVLNIRYSAGFSILLLSDYLKLESQYAYRWFEIIFSRAGHVNNEGHFFVRYTIEEIKTLFVIGEKKYPRAGDFRNKVIDSPLQEINNKKIGFHIFPDYFYKHKKLAGVTLRCRFSKRENGTETIAYLMSRYPKDYFQCHAEAKKLLCRKQFKSQNIRDMAYMHKALELLRAKVEGVHA
ncbi:MAG: replication initiation protein [Treponema sp.]|nr:replication initiation protein [Treponema sp.]